MIKRYWIVTCDGCGKEVRFNGSVKPSDAEMRNKGFSVMGIFSHYCESCAKKKQLLK